MEAELSLSTVISRTGIMHLKRYWEKSQLRKTGKLPSEALQTEWNIDNALLAALGLGLEQTIKQIYLSPPDFTLFEDWVLSVNEHQLSKQRIEAFNTFIINQSSAKKEHTIKKVLDEDALNSWNENGYIIIKAAISKDDCAATIAAICDFIDIDKEDKTTWYKPHPSRQGIMVQLFQHPALEKNRHAPKIREAYEQLWNRKDIWVNTDRVGFNPPETDYWKFPGPRLHWDVSLAQPIPFGLQGILYLADTAPDQGAFTLVPGFQHRVADWLNKLPAGTNPRTENVYELGAVPIVANAGDFIIWHHALPHGSSPNTSSLPRFVQYINYAPLDATVHEVWI